ncbi:IS110 family transposase [Paenibacillus sambharensis]|uniref:IS110 family transposase n=1 Tax=Paenibacillus sambharensis TaxID=1803190 RepID=A0A2W1LXW7_9BACL|nr:IS110 family transposase [Paenibacillus sambharensis]PZD95757.1 IS110 family transposase [Paenibacillus sambharensis]PZD96041.1 IS110 family transposase [Paenibacillus sambharensis]PZD96216.1 IS110 family transposase [Paenibacillus sambharensis]PZD96332.1 IS110 family transposase [Paenibacillus sambharensis]PZD96357.1 IS110 family transposase [Paenibacillus sambharensis]
MKSTVRNATNQRIERITMQHVVVGIDIAKDAHAAQITDFRGRSLTSKHLSFTNSLEGFERLLDWIKKAQAKHSLTSLLVGLEPTGHYWFNLANWLLQQGIEVVLVNPVTTHRNKENRDNSPSKNDPKDALVIADVVSRGYYTEYSPHAAVFRRLKTLMSDREFWVKQSACFANRIIRWIDLYFPEFRQVFPNWATLRSLASLKAFPLPSDLEGLDVDAVIAQWRDQGMKRASGVSGRAKAAELLAAATRSIGDRQALQEARDDIDRLLAAYEHTAAMLDDIEQALELLLADIPLIEQLRSIQGLGTIALAAILSGTGDLRHYAHGQQILRRAGLNLAERTSGKFKGQVKVSKRGDSTLRKHLYWGMLSLVQRHPDFKQWHANNRARGMKKQASLFKLIGKLARILVGMAQRGESYRECADLVAA